MTRYLTEKEIVAINYAVIKNLSPTEDFGVKEPSALNSCVAQPKQEIFGRVLYPTTYDKAAILFEMLINKHCFRNGNKRTAVMAVFSFMKLNDIQLHASNKELADVAVEIASQRGDKRLTHEKIVEWLKQHSQLL